MDSSQLPAEQWATRGRAKWIADFLSTAEILESEMKPLPTNLSPLLQKPVECEVLKRKHDIPRVGF